jgi:hypothetical protein
MGLVVIGGLLGLVIVSGVTVARALAASRSEPALGERYVNVPGSDLTTGRRKSHGDGGGDGSDWGDGDGGD